MKSRLLLALILFLNIHMFSQDYYEDYFSGSINLGISFRVTEGRTDYAESKPGVGLFAEAEYYVPSSFRSKFGLKILAGGQNIYGKDTRKIPTLMRSDMLIAGLGINYAYCVYKGLYPYIFLGISNLWFDPKFDDGDKAPNNLKDIYSKTALSYDFGGGLKYSISEIVAVTGELQLHFVASDYLDDFKSGDYKDTYLSASIGITFALNKSKDNDMDGILNRDDACPDMAEDQDGYLDNDGCPDPDNDNDGILDIDDDCPGIPEDMDGFNDKDGCPDHDNDNDRIPDVKDNCQNDQEDFDGFEDQDGCPDPDNDSDGIADSLDGCRNAAEDIDGFEDNDGCPDPDNDNDGILDIHDKCPDRPETLNGYNDKDGCPDTVPEVKRKNTESVKPGDTDEDIPVNINSSQREIVIPGANIFSGEKSTELKSKIPDLDRFVKTVQSDIDSRWKIEVYLDNGPQGEADNISVKRADAILQYFVSKGLPSFQFLTQAMGSRKPIINNSTQRNSKNGTVVLRKIR